MYGEHVHRAVLGSGVSASAATLRLVDAEYDIGPVIAQRPVPIVAGDDVSSLRDRVQQAERELLIQIIPKIGHPGPVAAYAASSDIRLRPAGGSAA
jgi:phosphoribosylglycinamide formyltransferase 1